MAELESCAERLDLSGKDIQRDAVIDEHLPLCSSTLPLYVFYSGSVKAPFS